ncbi:uncharacterized protein EI90DRAFT_3136866 [Cantharellus anzutake]|uniref:uncharacterized protein n=1 Tax=Cantharellus anzutake TaxID=1750568 RepID=UPI001905C95B|nr:uncharacterized protein EI90DRAFT_3136866 [Cantharellus anzutake]KAF8313168.1 hypothetical protein EI90DRAFT_3136866 [Cantharellus anzutake]
MLDMKLGTLWDHVPATLVEAFPSESKSLTSPSLHAILDDLPHQDATLARAITAPHKHPIDDSGIHPNSTALVHEDQYSETVEDL